MALILAGFVPILAPLAVAAHLAGKRVAPATSGSLAVESVRRLDPRSLERNPVMILSVKAAESEKVAVLDAGPND